VAFFPPRWSWRRRPPVPCSDCLALSAVPTAPGCPPHVWRCSRPGAGECRASRAAATSPPLGPLLPSYAPGRRHGCRAPGRCRRGGGAAHGRRGRPSPPGEAPERGSHHPPRAAGAWPRGSWAFPEAAPHAWQSPRRRLPPCTSRAASGAPAPRPTPGATCTYRRPGGVFTCQRRPAPAAGPGASRRCPGRGWAPIASGTCGQREGPAARARPLPSRPTCETPGLFGSLRSRRVCPPPLWPP
jgi:hypothetical protein